MFFKDLSNVHYYFQNQASLSIHSHQVYSTLDCLGFPQGSVIGPLQLLKRKFSLSRALLYTDIELTLFAIPNILESLIRK